ncbi:MAG: hypothetical protein WD491_00720 [Balneolales bacterium]
MCYKVITYLLFVFIYSVQDVLAQDNLFTKPEFEKVSKAERSAYESRFSEISWSGAGFGGSVIIDDIPTSEIRARLEAAFGEPTQKVDDLINQEGFRPGHYIQFEYWFIINGSMPLMILDIDGPFGNGLVYGGASRYIDMMPEIKRTLSEVLMDVDQLGEYQDYYFDLDDEQWYEVSYDNGSFDSKEIGRPAW